MLISPEFFTTLGVSLPIGRPFTEAQLSSDAEDVAILSDGYWRAHFNKDPDVIGHTFVAEGRKVSVVGVLPANFRFLSEDVQIFRPASHPLQERQADYRHTNGWSMIARLGPGETVANAQAQIDALNVVQAVDDPHASFLKESGYHTVVTSLHDDYVREAKPVLLLLQTGVLFLLLMGGVNLANLFMVRLSARLKQVAICRALGASDLSVVFEVILETSFPVICGGVGGILLAAVGLDFFQSFGAEKLPLGAALGLNGHIIQMAIIEMVVVEALLVIPSLWPTLYTNFRTDLYIGTHGTTASSRAQTLRHCFVVAQVVIAFVLLSSSGLLNKSLKRALETPVGFSPDQVLTGNITLPLKDYENGANRLSFVERLLTAVRTLPGVTGAAINTQLPFNGINSNHVMAVEGISMKPGENVRAQYLSGVAGDYWTLMDIPLVRGRLLEDADNHRMPPVCVVDEAFAERYWSGENPLGHRVSQSGDTFDRNSAYTVVGVVANVKQSDLTEGPGHGSVYIPYSASSFRSFALALKTKVPQGAMALMIQKAVRQIDAGVLLDDLRIMQSRIDDSLVGRRSPAMLSEIFAAVALALAAIGTYGVLGYAVARRRREIGVRIALGATSWDICKQFLSIGLRLIVVGVFFGILGAWTVGQALEGMLYSISSFDISTIGTVVAIMSFITMTASFLPAFRASRVNPLIALRAE